MLIRLLAYAALLYAARSFSVTAWLDEELLYVLGAVAVIAVELLARRSSGTAIYEVMGDLRTDLEVYRSSAEVDRASIRSQIAETRADHAILIGVIRAELDQLRTDEAARVRVMVERMDAYLKSQGEDSDDADADA